MIILAIACILSGAFFLYRNLKYPVHGDEKFLNEANLKGYGFSVGLILIGLIILSKLFPS